MSPFPSSFATATQPLSDLLTDPTASELLQQLATRNYEVQLGLTPAFADILAELAHQPSIREYCPRDSAERFADRAGTERWLSKGRATFLLCKRTDEGQLRVAGYGWSGRETSPPIAPGGETTFALRISETDQGQGLATPFAQIILSATATLYGAPHLWLETWASNGGAVHAYQKLGFVLVAEKPSPRPTPDGQTTPDTRLFMTLPN